MISMLKKIRETEDYERNMFGARKQPFREHMDRWISQLRPDQPAPPGSASSARIS